MNINRAGLISEDTEKVEVRLSLIESTVQLFKKDLEPSLSNMDTEGEDRSLQ